MVFITKRKFFVWIIIVCLLGIAGGWLIPQLYIQGLTDIITLQEQTIQQLKDRQAQTEQELEAARFNKAIIESRSLYNWCYDARVLQFNSADTAPAGCSKFVKFLFSSGWFDLTNRPGWEDGWIMDKGFVKGG